MASYADYILKGSPALAFAGGTSNPIVHLTRRAVSEDDLRQLRRAWPWRSRKLTATTATVTIGDLTFTIGAILEEDTTC